jgi:predicted nucleic acid-binding protein
VKRVIIDSNIADKLEADPEARGLRDSLVDAQRLEILHTAIQAEEVACTPQERKRDDKLAALHETERTEEVGFFLDVSHLDEAVFGTPEEIEFVASVRGTRTASTTDKKWLNKTRDGIIAASAVHAGAILVTENETDFRAAEERGLVVWRFAQFRAWLISEAASL